MEIISYDVPTLKVFGTLKLSNGVTITEVYFLVYMPSKFVEL